MNIDGIFSLNKPAGLTSFQVVSRVRRLTGERRVGHSGTLDPIATGVLLVCLGQGTRVIEFMSEASKTYRAEVRLGVETDSYDIEGSVTATHDIAGLTREDILKALPAFHGEIQQVPPMYSAVKLNGKPLYALARSGIEVERKPRTVHLYRVELTAWEPPLATLEIDCSTGTYIRSLAHDLGQALGCGGHVKSLVRLRCGVFHVEDAISLEDLETAFREGYWGDLIHPIDDGFLHWDAMVVGEAGGDDVRHGRTLGAARFGRPRRTAPHCRVYSAGGDFLAALAWRPDEQDWHPYKVFSPAK